MFINQGNREDPNQSLHARNGTHQFSLPDRELTVLSANHQSSLVPRDLPGRLGSWKPNTTQAAGAEGKSCDMQEDGAESPARVPRKGVGVGVKLMAAP